MIYIPNLYIIKILNDINRPIKIYQNGISKKDIFIDKNFFRGKSKNISKKKK